MLKTEWYNAYDDGFEDGIELRNRVLALGPEVADNEAMHLVLYEGDSESDKEKAVGYGRVCFAGGDFVIDRICVAEGSRGKGYADFMLRLIIRRLFVSGAESYFAYSTARSKSLFTRLGFDEAGTVNELGYELIRFSRSGDVSGGCV